MYVCLVAPKVVEPIAGQQIHVSVGQNVSLNCVATGDPAPTTHWDRNRTVLLQLRKYLSNNIPIT